MELHPFIIYIAEFLKFAVVTSYGVVPSLQVAAAAAAADWLVAAAQ
jgi:hypothetical protein